MGWYGGYVPPINSDWHACSNLPLENVPHTLSNNLEYTHKSQHQNFPN
jgi:hypothetical protein